MLNTEKAEYQEFLEKSLKYLQAKGFENIQVELEGFEAPKTYLRKGSDNRIMPDIVAEKNGRQHFFDLSLKSESPTLLKSKWLFMETLSKLKDGTFRLITTKGHYKFTDDMLADIHLENKTPIKII